MDNNKIENIKIYGERNSGTNFLYELLQNNLIDVNLYSGSYFNKTGWKHGYPKIHLIKNLKNTLFIFIIRDLEKWLKSMYVTPYHFEKIDDINSFLTKKLKINDFRKNHDVNKYKFEKDINIFDLRYLKIKSYFECFKFIKNGLIINLEDIQADKGFKLIKTLNQSFKININNNFIPILKHTKTKKNEQNKKIIIKLNDYIVNHNKNKNIENKINNLKNNYLIKTIF
jgi:hypothetical protein